MGDRNMTKFSVGKIGNTTWDQKGRTEIVQIIITHTSNCVHSLQFLYYEDGNLVLSDLFGQAGASSLDIVKLNYPSEFITCVSGGYDEQSLLSIEFTTNAGRYGPFGTISGTSRYLTRSEYRFYLGEGCVFGGFYGSFYTYKAGICSIGVYMKLPTTLNVEDQNHPVVVSRRS